MVAILSDYENEIISRAQARREEQQARDEMSRVQVALDSVCATHQGRVVLKSILSVCEPDKPTFTTDPITTAYNEGTRAVGIFLKDFLGKEYLRAVEDEEI